MTHCYQIKFSLDYETFAKNPELSMPAKTKHSSFIMRLKSNNKAKISKYQLGARRPSLLDELSSSLQTPMSRQISEVSKPHFPDFIKLNLKSLVSSSLKKEERMRIHHSPFKSSHTGLDWKKRASYKTEERITREESLNATQLAVVQQSCPLYTPKSQFSPRKKMVSSHARLRTLKSKPYDQFYGDQRSEDNIKIMMVYYRDFLWKVAFSNQHQLKAIERPKVYIGKGNNSRLVKSLMRSRWWWVAEKDQANANFVWTQLKISSIYPNQRQSKNVKNQLQPREIQQNCDPKLKGDPSSSILNQHQQNEWNEYFKKFQKQEKKINQNLDCRKVLHKSLKTLDVNKVSNHLEFSRMLGNKKALFYTMRQYYQLSQQDYRLYLPLTYHIVSGTEDEEYTSFLKAYSQNRKQGKMNMWIVKPGELSNRGNGIKVCNDLNQIREILKSKATHSNGRKKTYIVQQYLSDPFLYKNRKFDIRHYMMVTSVDGVIKGYWYQEGYIRTTSFQYSLNQLGGFVHLTNDAVQKYSKDYGKYQKGNKLSYSEFQAYLDDKHSDKKYNFNDVLVKMKKVATDAIRAAYLIIDPKKRQHNFQIFGLDFMIDAEFNPWLIECNTNPCIQLSSPVLMKVIPGMLDNALRIGLDPLFPPPPNTYPIRKVPIDNNKFHLVFDELIDQAGIRSLYKNQKSVAEFLEDIGSDDQAYEDNSESQDC